MNAKSITMGLLVAAISASAYGVNPFVGAWALESSPGDTCIVMTNGMVWVKEVGQWRPGTASLAGDSAITFRLVGDPPDPLQCLRILDRQDLDRRRKIGLDVKKRDCLWECRARSDKRGTYRFMRKVVRSEMPKLALDNRQYAGFWKIRKTAEGDKLASVTNILIKVRDDGIFITYDRFAKLSRDRPVPYELQKIVPLECGCRYDWRERYQEYAESLGGRPRALWMDPSGMLNVVGHDSRDYAELVRTDETFPDPLDENRLMMEKNAYHGIWGVSREFNIFTLSFEPEGDGVIGVSMAVIPFKWKSDSHGRIECVLDSDAVVIMGGFCTSIVCQYDCIANTMKVTMPPNEDEGAYEPMIKTYGLMSQVTTGVREYLKRYEEMKLDPQWKCQLERAREREKPTPEQLVERQRKYKEKQAARKAAAAKYEADEAKKRLDRKMREDVVNDYSIAVRNDAYYSEKKEPPAVYLQGQLRDRWQGTAQDNHEVVERIRKNPELMALYGDVAYHVYLLDEDLDWLVCKVLEDCAATQDEYRLERFVDEHYDRFTRNQMERIFGNLSDESYVKELVFKVARERFDDFHADWRKGKKL